MTDRRRVRPGTIARVHGTAAWRAALLAGVAALIVGQADPADAQVRKAKRSYSQSKKDVPIRHPFGENMPKGPLQLVVVIGDQRAILYSNGIRVADTKVSTGTASHPTPTGVFSIIQKNRWHRSNLYGNAPMYYMHRLTWSGIALHEGHLPGFAASHGCVRMPTDFVSRLWNVSRMGMRVVVVRNEVAPREFSHAKLFTPAVKPPDNTPRVSQAIDGLRPALATEAPAPLIRVAEAQPSPAEATASDAPETAASAPAPQAGAPKAAATGTAGIEAPPPPAYDQPVTTSSVTAPTLPTSAVPAPTSAVPAPTSAVPSPTVAPAPADVPPAVAPAAVVATVVTAEPEKPAVDADEVPLPRPAPLRTRAAEPSKLSGQVAVFISRKEKRIYIRHAFVPLFDMPIEIANPDKAFGTHTYTALEVADGGARMRWNVISLEPAGPPPVRGRKAAPKASAKNAKGKAVQQVAAAPPKVPFSDAAEALDRVTIPQEALDRVGELLTPGSSLIISDEGLGRETGRYTEFIVETRH